ncbi:MAG: type II toxin-antitoxin system VapC family toxin [Promethearchaeota archaeon]|nr:MAG: type II toxin-antitoxin system VapC family toxin [Candidatus Lokiarchaeota archaeon]
MIRKKVKIDSELDEEILFITEITVYELYFGLFSNNILNKDPEKLQKRIDTLSKILSKFQILPFSRDESIQSAKILGQLKLDRKTIEFRDGMIAGSRFANGITKILTRNADHFDRIPGIQTITYELH